MDINANEVQNENDYYKLPLDALGQTTRKILSRSLNPPKILMSEEGMHRDFRGIANLAGFNKPEASIMPDNDPMGKLLLLWRREDCNKTNKTATFGHLLEFLGKIDRWDVADDLKESLAEDAKAYDLKNYQERVMRARQEASTAGDDFIEDKCANLTFDKNYLTDHDVENAKCGYPPQQYDAFVLFADEDFNIAWELIERLEEDRPNFGFKLCYKELLLAGISIENDAILHLIIERCDRLIVIFTKAFLKSPANAFFTSYTAALQIEQRKRKIIPCLYEQCELPTSLNFFFTLKYYNTAKLFNFWEKLSRSIQKPPHNAIMTRVRTNPLPRIQIEEVEEEKQEQKAITPSSASVNNPRKKAPKAHDAIELASEPHLRGASSMIQLNSFAVHDTNDNYRSECDLSLVGSVDHNTTKSSRSKKTKKWFKVILSSISPGSKTDLPVTSSLSLEPEKPKPKKNWLQKKMATN